MACKGSEAGQAEHTAGGAKVGTWLKGVHGAGAVSDVPDAAGAINGGGQQGIWRCCTEVQEGLCAQAALRSGVRASHPAIATGANELKAKGSQL